MRVSQQRFASGMFEDWKSDSVSLTLLDGEKREKQKARNYSWIITPESRLAATKAHIAELREICLSPPSFPIAVCLRDGLGKTHELHRTPIVLDWPMRVNLDGRIAIYDREQLESRLAVCRELVQVMGKGAETAKTAFTSHNPHGWGWRFGDDFLCEWMRIRNQHLTRLAWFLCENKGELNERACD